VQTNSECLFRCNLSNETPSSVQTTNPLRSVQSNWMGLLAANTVRSSKQKKLGDKLIWFFFFFALLTPRIVASSITTTVVSSKGRTLANSEKKNKQQMNA
jgi:hypothetical protein